MKNYRVRIIIEKNIEAENEMQAESKADIERSVNDHYTVDVLHEYRMPVRYNCCEEGHTYGYTYTYAKNREEAKFKFVSEWEPDIEADPCFEDIEFYDEEYGEWL